MNVFSLLSFSMSKLGELLTKIPIGQLDKTFPEQVPEKLVRTIPLPSMPVSGLLCWLEMILFLITDNGEAIIPEAPPIKVFPIAS